VAARARRRLAEWRELRAPVLDGRGAVRATLAERLRRAGEADVRRGPLMGLIGSVQLPCGPAAALRCATPTLGAGCFQLVDGSRRAAQLR